MAEIMVALSSDDQTISVPLATVFGTGIARIEQTVTSDDPEIPNEITCTLTNGQQSKFYIKNGKDGYSPSITIEQSAEGYSITVTDEEGSHEYSIIVDSTLDAESANPIQNQAVAGAVTQLTSDITAEVTRATNAESAIRTEASQVYATVNALNAASSALHDEVTGEYARATAVEEVLRTATTNNATSISTEVSRAQAEEARIEGLTANTVKYTEQTLTYLQQQQARANIGAITASEAPVQSVNGQTGAVSLTASDVGALPSSTAIPSKTSDLTNDSHYITAQTVANKADKDGTYPDMTVGSVMSSDGSTDSTPYLYRVSGGGVEVGNIEADKIVGGTVAFNQLAGKNTTGATTNGVTFTPNADGSVSVNGTASATAIQYVTNPARVMAIVGHKYFACGCPSGGSVNTWQLSIRVNSGGTKVGDDYGSGAILVFTTSTANDCFAILMRVATGATINAKFMPQLFDLTQMFGSTVADYIYSLEQSSTGAGVAFFRKLFPKDYYKYNTGELMSVEGVSAHVMRDADDNIIGNYPLDSSLTLRGIPKLYDGLYFDGDTYEADGTVTRKYGVVDLGTLNWRSATDSTGQYFASTLSPTAKSKTGSELGNNICSKYPISASTNVYDGSLAISNQGTTLYVRDTSYTDATAFKSAMSGVMLVYKLKTPTTESAEPYESIQKVSKYGTEEYVSTGIVPVGHVTKYPTDIVAKVNGLPSDFSTLIAPTETGFKATRAYSVNQFIIVNNQLYRVTSAIANGATITVGTNVVATTVADILTALLNA